MRSEQESSGEADSQAKDTGDGVTGLAATLPAVALRRPDVEGARLREGWRKSPERRRTFVAPAVIFGVAIVIAGLAALIGALTADPGDKSYNAEIAALASAGVAAYLGVPAWALYRRQQRRAWFDRTVLLEARADLSRAEAEAELEEDDLDLATLWSLTQKRLDYYHGLATSQAEKSFTYGVVAAGAGLLVILASAVAAAIGRSAAASVAAGLVGLGGAGLAGYLGATFMSLQENASTQLRAYFEQPLDFSRFLAAERLLAQLDPEDRPLATRDLVRALARVPTVDSEPSSR